MTQTKVKTKELPNDKLDLLEGEGYEMFNRELIRKVFPRIIAEVKQVKPKAKVGDIIPFYFAVVSYIDGNKQRADGTPNERFGYAFPSQAKIAEMTGIDRKRHKQLTEILKENGIFAEVKDHFEGTNRYLWYKPSFCPKVSEDGYLVDKDGQKIVPNYNRILK